MLGLLQVSVSFPSMLVKRIKVVWAWINVRPFVCVYVILSIIYME